MSQSYTWFRAEVVGVRQLTPHLRRITFGGPELAGMVSVGLDQRIKLLFPLPGQTAPIMLDGADWYADYRAMPDQERPVMRTYTARHFRPEAPELDVDFVLHGNIGPGSAWAGAATPGDQVAILAPDAAHSPIIGYEFSPPADTDWLLLAGDDTALPAITSIIESLPAGRRVLAFVEIDSLAEMLPIHSPADVRLTWLTRSGRTSADALLRTAVADTRFPAGKPYAWLAAECGSVTDLRRHLVNDRTIDKELIYFSGYWLRGSAIE